MVSRKSDNELLEFNKACHDAVATQYSKKHLDIFNSVEQHRLMNELSELKKHFPLDSCILDFGCGSGNLTDHLMNFGFHVVSADVSRNFLDLVAERYRDNPRHSVYILTGNPSLDFKEMKFDAICMYSVLHHVPNYLVCLRNLAHCVSPGGVIYIDHEASPSFWNNQDLYKKLQKQTKLQKLKSNYRKLFSYKWYKARLHRIKNPRYQEEGDIHVWDDDHIEWGLIDEALNNLGFDKIRNHDYLVYQNHYGINLYDQFKEVVNDMRVSIYKKRLDV
jgi:ubiquinone/menaquinone biosynthesis C-methylase UbiE